MPEGAAGRILSSTAAYLKSDTVYIAEIWWLLRVSTGPVRLGPKPCPECTKAGSPDISLAALWAFQFYLPLHPKKLLKLAGTAGLAHFQWFDLLIISVGHLGTLATGGLS
jgi:hypothetical protein